MADQIRKYGGYKGYIDAEATPATAQKILMNQGIGELSNPTGKYAYPARPGQLPIVAGRAIQGGGRDDTDPVSMKYRMGNRGFTPNDPYPEVTDPFTDPSYVDAPRLEGPSPNSSQWDYTTMLTALNRANQRGERRYANTVMGTQDKSKKKEK